jgi:FMN-dependent NADH-azoreductase
MSNILVLKTSLFGADGQSSRLADRLVAELTAHAPGARVVERDLARDPVPHLTAATFRAFATPAAERSAAEQAAVDASDALIAELRAADVVVLGLPMYNFGVPSTLKAYFDHVARAGVTFRYARDGAEGLLTGKKAYVLATRGGAHAGTPLDTETAYVRDFLRFVGIAEVAFVHAEGLSMTATREASLGAAHAAIRTLAAPALAAAA